MAAFGRDRHGPALAFMDPHDVRAGRQWLVALHRKPTKTEIPHHDRLVEQDEMASQAAANIDSGGATEFPGHGETLYADRAMAPALDIAHLTKHYRMGHTVVRALDGVSLTVSPGEFVGLLGTSGSGKSTLLNLIAGLDSPTAGTLRVFDRDLAGMSRQELSGHRSKSVGIIFQSFNLISTMTASENVALSMMFAGVPRAQREQRATALLASVGLAGRGHHRPKELSGGEQQRVAIARALANEPDLLLADEPTGNLDSRTSSEIMTLLRQLNADRKKTVIMVTHDPGLASKYAHRTVTMLDGTIVSEVIS